ncbi:MAG: hypothetical protein ACTSVZ_09885, partial [Promethearchaeota archaeon]
MKRSVFQLRICYNVTNFKPEICWIFVKSWTSRVMTSEIPVERDIPAIMQSFCLMVIPFPRAFFKYHYQDYNIMIHLSA